MLKVTFLGTAGSTPTKTRNVPSVAVDYNGRLFLFDCGEGTQRQCMFYSVNISRIRAIFISHIHGDHTIGLPGLIRTLSLNRRTEPLHIFIPKGSEDQLLELINFDRAMIGYKLIITPILKAGIIYKEKDFSISAFKLVHTITTYGFVLKENDSVRFVKPKVKSLGIKGEMFQTLLKNKSIKIGNKLIKLDEVSVKKQGLKLVYATDTRPTNATAIAAKEADILIHEATYGDAEKRLAKERHHSTTIEATTIAKKARVKRLALVHISARYKDTDQLLKEAKKIFKNTEIASDGLTITI